MAEQSEGDGALHLDDSRSTDLWTALRAGRVDGYADRYPADALGATTR